MIQEQSISTLSRKELNNILKNNSQYESFLSNKKTIFIINQLVNDIKAQSDYNPSLLYYYLYFVHYIIDRNNRIKSNLLDKVPINAIRIQNLLDVRYYKEVLSFLTNHKFINRDYYIPKHNKEGLRGRFYHYSLNPKYIQYKVERKVVENEFIKSLNGKQFHIFYKNAYSKLQNHDKIDFIINCLNDLQIHDDHAIDFINKSDLDKFEYESRYLNINKFNTSSSFVIDNTGGRLHSKITTLSADLRDRFLFLKSDPSAKLVQLDIGNSQPLFFALLLLEKYKPSNPIKQYTIYSKDVEYQRLRKLNNSYFTNKTRYKNQYKDELKKYIRWVESGNFYKQFANKSKMTDIEYKNFKVNFFSHVFYNDFKKPYVTKEEKVFMNHFPVIYNIICHIKYNDFKQFPIQLQRKESKFIIKFVSDELFARKIFFVTIHDAVVIKEQYVQEVYGIINKLFIDSGITAKIKIDTLFKSNLDISDLELSKKEFEGFEIGELVDYDIMNIYVNTRLEKENKSIKDVKLKKQRSFFKLMKKNNIDLYHSSDSIFYKMNTKTHPVFVNYLKTIRYDNIIIKCKNQKELITTLKYLKYEWDN